MGAVMPDLKTETVTRHSLTLTDAELAEIREAARCALDLSATDEHAPIWRMLARLGAPPTRATAQGGTIDG